MTEKLTEIWREYRAAIRPGDVVIDIGCSDGYFSDWATLHGARVARYDARHGLAVGPYDGFCVVKGEGLGAYIVPNRDGGTPMIGLSSILAQYPFVDFLKCDIEGGEYLIFGCDLSNVGAISLEFHVWTTPDSPREGLGIKDEPMPDGAFDTLVAQLGRKHVIEVVGDPEAGGYLHAVLR